MADLYDVIVIGGGPAGGSAAYYLGEAGKRVLLLEKETLPRYKTCGGGVPARTLEMFPFSCESAIESRIKAVSYSLGSRSATFPLADSSICMVMRDRFDALILSHTRAEIRAGVSVRKVHETSDRVIVESRSGEQFEGRYLVAADGASSVAARSLGLRRDKTLAAGLEVECAAPPQVFERFRDHPLFIFGEIKDGYLWVFPKSSHLSVGIAALRPRPGELQSVLNRVMTRLEIPLKDRPTHGHPLPLYSGVERIAAARSLLVGDAAGLVDPFNGEGIRFALKSGQLAAEAILNEQLEAYSASIQRQIGSYHHFARFLALLFYRFPRTSFALGVRNPFATRAFAELMSDRANYPLTLARLFGSLPLYLLTESAAALVDRLGGLENGRRVRTAVYRVL